MKCIISKSVESRLSDKDKSLMTNYWSLLEGGDFAAALVYDPNEKPKKDKKKRKKN